MGKRISMRQTDSKHNPLYLNKGRVSHPVFGSLTENREGQNNFDKARKSASERKQVNKLKKVKLGLPPGVKANIASFLKKPTPNRNPNYKGPPIIIDSRRLKKKRIEKKKTAQRKASTSK